MTFRVFFGNKVTQICIDLTKSESLTIFGLKIDQGWEDIKKI